MRTGGTRGFSLLEMLLAMAVFAMAGLALTRALSLLGMGAVESDEAAWRDAILEARLTELQHRREIRAGQDRVMLEDGEHILTEKVELLPLRAGTGDVLDRFYRIEVEIRDRSNGVVDRLETYRYGNVFAP